MFLVLRYALLIILGFAIAVYDYISQSIPNKLVLSMLAGWAALVTAQTIYEAKLNSAILLDAFGGAAAGGGLFLLVYLVSRRRLGGGDVKFMTAVGLYLGFDGVLLAMFFGIILAGLTALTLYLHKRVGSEDVLPFAPFLYGGILITVFHHLYIF